MPKQLVIVGAGGVGREIAAVIKKHPLTGYEFVGFIDDGVPAGTLINGYKVLGGTQWIFDNAHNALGVILAFGNPQVRKKVAEKLSAIAVDFPSIIHPGASIHDEDTVVIGKGCYIADACVLTTDITIADFCFINTACTLQHDTTIENYSVLMPGVRITGGAAIGEATYIAPNCVIAITTVIDKNSVIRESVII